MPDTTPQLNSKVEPKPKPNHSLLTYMHDTQAVLKPGVVPTWKHFMAVAKLFQVFQSLEYCCVDYLIGQWAQLRKTVLKSKQKNVGFLTVINPWTLSCISLVSTTSGALLSSSLLKELLS